MSSFRTTSCRQEELCGRLLSFFLTPQLAPPGHGLKKSIRTNLTPYKKPRVFTLPSEARSVTLQERCSKAGEQQLVASTDTQESPQHQDPRPVKEEEEQTPGMEKKYAIHTRWHHQSRPFSQTLTPAAATVAPEGRFYADRRSSL